MSHQQIDSSHAERIRRAARARAWRDLSASSRRIMIEEAQRVTSEIVNMLEADEMLPLMTHHSATVTGLGDVASDQSQSWIAPLHEASSFNPQPMQWPSAREAESDSLEPGIALATYCGFLEEQRIEEGQGKSGGDQEKALEDATHKDPVEEEATAEGFLSEANDNRGRLQSDEREMNSALEAASPHTRT